MAKKEINYWLMERKLNVNASGKTIDVYGFTSFYLNSLIAKIKILQVLNLKKYLTNFTISGFTLLNFAAFSQPAKSDHHTVSVCPDSGTVSALPSDFCAGTPSKYEISIYELALCESDPIQGNAGSKALDTSSCAITMSSPSSTTVDLGGSAIVDLPNAPSRPSSGTYRYSYVILKNTFGLKGSYELQGGNTYYSTSDGRVKTTGPAASYQEVIDDFGDDSWDPEWGPYDHPTGGTISALLLNNTNGRASSQADATRLVGVFETNSGNPVVINDSTKGVKVTFSVTNSAMGIEADESGIPVDYGSGPFKPSFSPIN